MLSRLLTHQYTLQKILHMIGNSGKKISSVSGMAVAGEAIESDEEIEIHNIENRLAFTEEETTSGIKMK